MTCLATKGVMRMGPTATVDVLMGLSQLTIDVETQARIYRLLCRQLWKPKSLNFSHSRKSQDMNMHLPYRWDLPQ
jgi:hypothetical protein